MTDYFIHNHRSLIHFCLWIIFRFVLINADVINSSAINLSVALHHSLLYIYWEHSKTLHFAERHSLLIEWSAPQIFSMIMYAQVQRHAMPFPLEWRMFYSQQHLIRRILDPQPTLSHLSAAFCRLHWACGRANSCYWEAQHWVAWRALRLSVLQARRALSEWPI